MPYDSIDRRQFLRKAAVTGIAGLAASGSVGAASGDIKKGSIRVTGRGPYSITLEEPDGTEHEFSGEIQPRIGRGPSGNPRVERDEKSIRISEKARVTHARTTGSIQFDIDNDVERPDDAVSINGQGEYGLTINAATDPAAEAWDDLEPTDESGVRTEEVGGGEYLPPREITYGYAKGKVTWAKDPEEMDYDTFEPEGGIRSLQLTADDPYSIRLWP